MRVKDAGAYIDTLGFRAQKKIGAVAPESLVKLSSRLRGSLGVTEREVHQALVQAIRDLICFEMP